MLHTKNIRRRYPLTALAGVVLLACATNANAQQGFKIALSSNEAVLAAPNDPVTLNIASWDSPLMRVVARSRPFVEILNTSATDNLTSIDITIGDTDFNFSDDFLGDFAVEGLTNAPGIGIASATTLNGGDVLSIDFANGGIAPNELIRFQIDLDPDPGVPGLFIHPDYRTVLYDLFENDDSDNSVFTANFSNGVDLSLTLPDVPDPGPNVFANGNIRPYSTEEFIDFIDPPAVNNIIPEPATAATAVMAMACGVAFRRRRG